MFKKIIFSLVVLSSLIVLMPQTTFAADPPTGDKFYIFGPDVVRKECVATGDCTVCDVFRVIVRVAEWLVGLAAVLAVVAIIVGAVFLVTSAGASDRVELGQKAIKGAVIGLLIVMLAWPTVHVLIAVLVNTSGANGSEDRTFAGTLFTSWSTQLKTRCDALEKKIDEAKKKQ